MSIPQKVVGRASPDGGASQGDLLGSEESDDPKERGAIRTVGPDPAQAPGRRPQKKVDLSDVIELTDRESDTEIIASSTRAKRRRKATWKIREGVEDRTKSNILSDTSRRKQRKLNAAGMWRVPSI